MKTPFSKIAGAALICAAVAICPLPVEAVEQEFDPKSFTWEPDLSPEGPMLVAVSLKSQRAAVYRNGVRIGECQISSGFKGHESPTGVFHILNKDADHHSKTYNNAPMPFSERLTRGGVALHAGSLPGYPSSHGCIHLPYEFSRKLFAITHVGTTVVITNEEPDVHVSDGHRVHFRSGASSEIVWNPHASDEGPVSLVFSSSDKRLYVMRNGITIGECPTHSGWFSKRPSGVSAFVFAGWRSSSGANPADPLWVHVGGPKSNHAEEMSEMFEIDPRFEYLLQGSPTKGTNLVITDQSITKDNRSEGGFSVLMGRKEEQALQEDEQNSTLPEPEK